MTPRELIVHSVWLVVCGLCVWGTASVEARRYTRDLADVRAECLGKEARELADVAWEMGDEAAVLVAAGHPRTVSHPHPASPLKGEEKVNNPEVRDGGMLLAGGGVLHPRDERGVPGLYGRERGGE